MDLISLDVVNGDGKSVDDAISGAKGKRVAKPKPQKREKTPEELAREKLLNRVEAVRARALERGIPFPDGLAENLGKQETKGAMQRAWRSYLRSCPTPCP